MFLYFITDLLAPIIELIIFIAAPIAALRYVCSSSVGPSITEPNFYQFSLAEPPDERSYFGIIYSTRSYRMIPQSTTVHTIFFKKLTYPGMSRPDELWIMERTDDGRDTWRPLETFLENLSLTNNRTTLQTTANQWRRHYDVPTISPSSPTASSFPVLPHPEHSNVHVDQPFTAIPDQLHILQSCWGRSAQHHSQGPPTSLYWPPWRSTPPSTPPQSLRRTTTSPTTPVLMSHPPGQPTNEEQGPMDMSDSSV